MSKYDGHTPGKLTVMREHNFTVVVAENGGVVAEVFSANGGDGIVSPSEITAANAALFADAPALLAENAQLRAALEKATIAIDATAQDWPSAQAFIEADIAIRAALATGDTDA